MILKVNYRTFNSGGKGGQHGNRTQNAVEASVLMPDGSIIKTTSKVDRSQHANKRIALEQLRDLVKKHLHRENIRGATKGFGSGDRVRTYHEPEDRVVDHDTGMRWSYKSLMSDDQVFSDMIDSRFEYMSRNLPAS